MSFRLPITGVSSCRATLSFNDITTLIDIKDVAPKSNEHNKNWTKLKRLLD